MISIVLITDEADPKMGLYFRQCGINAKECFNGQAVEIVEIVSKNLNTAYIEIALEKFQGRNFMCFVYSHGESSSFIARERFIIEATAAKFSNSLFYTFSCHTGTTIGANLIRAGCRSFFGYTREASIVLAYLTTFVGCANFGIVKIVEGSTMRHAFDQMQENYNEQIDKLYMSDYFVASVLMENRDAMVLLGEGGNTIADYVYDVA